MRTISKATRNVARVNACLRLLKEFLTNEDFTDEQVRETARRLHSLRLFGYGQFFTDTDRLVLAYPERSDLREVAEILLGFCRTLLAPGIELVAKEPTDRRRAERGNERRNPASAGATMRPTRMPAAASILDEAAPVAEVVPLPGTPKSA